MNPFSSAFPVLVAAAAALPAVVAATEVVPTGYTLDQATSCGLYCYHDGTTPSSVAGELTDGRYGFAGWAAGNNADAWVGWLNKPQVNIDFAFGGAVVAIDSVSVGSTQNRLDDVVLPSIDIYAWNGSGWSFVKGLAVPEDAANNQPVDSTQPHTFLTLSGLGISASALRVVVKQSLDGPWSFVDEVDFHAATVPEPSSWALAAAGLALLAGRRAIAR